MNFARWMKTTFANARPTRIATQVEAQEATKQMDMCITNGVLILTIKVRNAGIFGGKPFNVMERETDVRLGKERSGKEL